MTGAADTGQATALKRALHSLGVFAVFSLLGPAIGGLLVFCLVYPAVVLFGSDTGDGAAQTAASSFLSLLGPVAIFVAAAYAFGGVQAVLTGVWGAVAAWRRRTFSRREIIVAAIIATLIWIAIVYSPLDPLDAADASGPAKIRNAVRIAISLTPVGVICALVCRWISRRLGLINDD